MSIIISFPPTSSFQALIPLCEDDNQSMEIILRLQKNLDILIQSMTRVSSRSEMLGAIHQVPSEFFLMKRTEKFFTTFGEARRASEII